MKTLLLAVTTAMVLAKAADLGISQNAIPSRPFTVAGERGALLGHQDGIFEAWQWPVKILSGFRISVELADYPIPIDVNKLAAAVDVRPEVTVITYSHAAFTIRQRMMAAREPTAKGASAAVVFEVESARPLDLTFSFTPEVRRMWPAPQFGAADGEWKSGGAYVLSTSEASFSALVAIPGSKPGILVPYQEHSQRFPLQFRVHVDPATSKGKTLPLLFAMRDHRDPETQMRALLEDLPRMQAATERYYQHFFDSRLVVDTPDERLNEAARWAELAIDQAQVLYTDGTIGLVAGYYESGDSARPGFAWYFGRDTLWTTYAINSYGDFALTQRALDFLFARQRGDGKVMHEFSQGAAFVDWGSTPYYYASADSTCLLVMAVRDYLAASGDQEYLRKHWEAVKRAFAFTRAHDSDGDGIYDNSQGTGWVESWPSGMPQQEIYLAALDEEASLAMKQMAAWMHDEAAEQQASATAQRIAERIPAEYLGKDGAYAFSHNADGSQDMTASIYPAVAWWDGTYELSNASGMFQRWASPEFSTDWGIRDISERTAFYDPISYHQGSVWPLFTGWTSLTEYRAGRPLAGYTHLMQNVNLTWAQDLGAVTELLSGQFFQPLGRSTSHQMWSSAMVLSPLLRGLFGLSWDAPAHTLRVAPSFPADWEHAALHNVHLGQDVLDLNFERQGNHWQVTARAAASNGRFCLQGKMARPGCVQSLQVESPEVEIGLPALLPEPGAATSQLKVVDQEYADRTARFIFMGLAGAHYNLPLRVHAQGVSVTGAKVVGDQLALQFPEGTGYQRAVVDFQW